jgi:hypothetical protein
LPKRKESIAEKIADAAFTVQKVLGPGKRVGFLIKRGIHFPVFAHIVGWVKREIGTIYVGFAYLNAPQKFEIATKLANPTRWLQTIGLTQPTIYRFGPRSGYPLLSIWGWF